MMKNPAPQKRAGFCFFREPANYCNIGLKKKGNSKIHKRKGGSKRLGVVSAVYLKVKERRKLWQEH